MSAFKPFIRITILSLIFAFLLIYLGVKYHWAGLFQQTTENSLELNIPEKTIIGSNAVVIKEVDSFAPEIIKTATSNKLLDSMNKEQIAEQCVNLLSKELKDPLTLEVATVNCVVSNFQETFQNSIIENNQIEIELQKKRLLLKQQCSRQYQKKLQYSLIEIQLMIGICISDKLNTH